MGVGGRRGAVTTHGSFATVWVKSIRVAAQRISTSPPQSRRYIAAVRDLRSLSSERSQEFKDSAKVFPEEEKIVLKGEVGREMFFIQRGHVEVINDTTGETLVELRDGQYFGEVAILCEARRT